MNETSGMTHHTQVIQRQLQLACTNTTTLMLTSDLKLSVVHIDETHGCNIVVLDIEPPDLPDFLHGPMEI